MRQAFAQQQSFKIACFLVNQDVAVVPTWRFFRCRPPTPWRLSGLGAAKSLDKRRKLIAPGLLYDGGKLRTAFANELVSVAFFMPYMSIDA